MKHLDAFDDQKMTGIYVDSLYLMTTTISTVGYGDFKAYNDNGSGWAAEMVYLITVTIFGIILFSSVTNEIFSYKKLQTVQEIVRKRCSEMEEYLYDISKLIKGKVMDREKIDYSIAYMKQSVIGSTRFYFENNVFF